MDRWNLKPDSCFLFCSTKKTSDRVYGQVSLKPCEKLVINFATNGHTAEGFANRPVPEDTPVGTQSYSRESFGWVKRPVPKRKKKQKKKKKKLSFAYKEA
eukprot:TRINITY_DN4694_c0_g1_i6.p1 TRINITY_DN4694_c0_g1~~TRINITY_DN4694_c0_g1_i6.p1  ORF type:complete len:100 (-),score=5.18 TRINITY_DN4694_c0_g1_i6:2708-3007(-)